MLLIILLEYPLILLPEFIRKLDKVYGEEGMWGFGYSEDFPQEWTYEYRKVKVWDKDDAEKVIDEYPLNKGKYIFMHLFSRKIRLQCTQLNKYWT